MIWRRTKPTTRGFVPWDETCVLEWPCWCWFRVSHRISTQFCTCEHLLCYAATSNASYVRVNIFRSLTELLPSHSEAVANERWNISTCVPRRSAREQIADGLRLNLHEFELRGQNFDRFNRWQRSETWSQPRHQIWDWFFFGRRCVIARTIISGQLKAPFLWFAIGNLFWRRRFLSGSAPRHKPEKSIESENDVEWRLFCWLLFTYSIPIVRSLPPRSQARFSSQAFYFLSAFQIQFQKKLAVLLFFSHHNNLLMRRPLCESHQ